MSINANVQIIIQIHNFKNINLPHKALYSLEVQIYQNKKNQINSALPYNIIETKNKAKKNGISKNAYLEDNIFRTKYFPIDYQQQQIDLNDVCEFRMVLNAFPALNEQQIYIEFILVQNSLNYFSEDVNHVSNFKEAERYRLKLESIKDGLAEYYEVQFSDTYISSFGFSLFIMLTDYKYSPYLPTHKSDNQKQKSRQKIENLDKLMNWSQKYYKQCEDAGKYFYQCYVKNLRYSSFLFKNNVNQVLKKVKKQFELLAPLGENGQIIGINEKQFFDYIINYFPISIDEDLLRREIYKINEENFFFLQKVTEHIQRNDFNINLMRLKYENQRKDCFSQRILKYTVFGKQIKTKVSNSKIASKLRKKQKVIQRQIIDERLFIKKQNQIYAFIEVNLPQSLKTKQFEENKTETVLRELSQLRRLQLKQKISYDERNMMVIFCHGFQASSFDMEIIKRELTKMLPVAVMINSTANQHDTEGDIKMMGMRLASEIKQAIERHFDNSEDVILNFVGHSMGGIIARASLQFLQLKKNQYGFYFSLSSPHLGYLSGVDNMIKTGLWFMRKMKSTKSLDQLAMEQTENLRESQIYKLSQKGHLKNFQKIILLSSGEDSYVPWHSARISNYQSKTSKTKIQDEMIENIIGDQIVHRVDIDFDIPTTKDLDSFIGRTAHINLLTQDSIMKLINYGAPNLFDLRQL